MSARYKISTLPLSPWFLPFWATLEPWFLSLHQGCLTISQSLEPGAVPCWALCFGLETHGFSGQGRFGWWPWGSLHYPFWRLFKHQLADIEEYTACLSTTFQKGHGNRRDMAGCTHAYSCQMDCRMTWFSQLSWGSGGNKLTLLISFDHLAVCDSAVCWLCF